jgi:hypothetical protein
MALEVDMNSNQSPARPIFRRLAMIVGVICLGACLAFLAVDDEESRRFGMIATGFVAFVMFTIGATGFWPPPKQRNSP